MVLQSPVRIAGKCYCYDEGGTKAPSLEVELGLVIHVHPAARHPMGRIPEAFGRLGHHCESTKIWYPLHSVSNHESKPQADNPPIDYSILHVQQSGKVT